MICADLADRRHKPWDGFVPSDATSHMYGARCDERTISSSLWVPSFAGLLDQLSA